MSNASRLRPPEEVAQPLPESLAVPVGKDGADNRDQGYPESCIRWVRPNQPGTTQHGAGEKAAPRPREGTDSLDLSLALRIRHLAATLLDPCIAGEVSKARLDAHHPGCMGTPGPSDTAPCLPADLVDNWTLQR